MPRGGFVNHEGLTAAVICLVVAAISLGLGFEVTAGVAGVVGIGLAILDWWTFRRL